MLKRFVNLLILLIGHVLYLIILPIILSTGFVPSLLLTYFPPNSKLSLMDALGRFLGRKELIDDIYGLDLFLVLLPGQVGLGLLLFGSLVVGHVSIYRQSRCSSTRQHGSGFKFC